jgi:hypothetical protein
MSARIIFFIVAGLAAATGGYAALAERRRHQRRDLDNVGWVPWTLVQVVAMVLAIGLFAIALKMND